MSSTFDWKVNKVRPMNTPKVMSLDYGVRTE
jgi:hypothetical protein